MATEVDVRAISAFTAASESSISNLINAPTQELVQAFLKAVEKKAKDYEQSESQKVRLEIELETVVRQNESKVKVLQNTRDKALADASQARNNLQTAENARSSLQAELEQLRSSAAAEATEVSNLKSRISSLEGANRDTLSLLESKTTAYEKLSQDLSAQHQKGVDLRKQISTLEQTVQTVNSASAAAKFKEQSLQQEIDLLKKNNEWLENERKIKADEQTNFRKEKNARISELSRSNEQYISESEALRRSESALKHRLEDEANRVEGLLQEIQRLQEEKISDADAFRLELESVNRLAELQKASADTARQRVGELSAALEEVREDAANEIGRIRAEIETEHNDLEAAERRVAELEEVLQQMQSELDAARARPSTPVRAVNGNGLSTPVRPGTPLSFTPASTSRLKGKFTTTQLYGEYQKLERDLAAEKQSTKFLQAQLENMLSEMEINKPEIDELRADHARIQSELLEMSTLIDNANVARHAAQKQLQTSQNQFQSKNKECEQLNQQLRDSAAQIRFLLMQQYVQEHGGSLSREDLKRLEAEANADMQSEMEHLSETQQIVNQQLVIYKSIAELQAINEKQLGTIRNLVERLESEESAEKVRTHHNLEKEFEIAQQKISTYQDEIRIMVKQSESFMKERDMFRNMLARRGQLPAQAEPADFSRSMPYPMAGGIDRRFDEGSVNGQETDYNKLLKELQNQFDTFREENNTDRSALRAQVEDLSKRNSQLQLDYSRAQGSLTAAQQRAEMLNANFNMLKNENAELQKRSSAAMENATKQELKTQQAAEELVEVRGLFESIQRESANLKAEKDLWKSVESRLIGDNESLRNERARLDQLTASLQNILNEREQADSETRRRLQAQVEALESELQSSKRKLNDEIEEAKRASLRREYEHEQNQKRIDDLFSSLSSTKEELAGAKTSRDHLQARVDELTVELRSAEERLDVLTRPAEEPQPTADGEDENAVSKEQQLSIEISELKRDLELRTGELERAEEQIEVYKSISQASEERLQELTETNDQYREETDGTIAEREAKIKDLEQRVDEISSELNTTNSELSQLRDKQADSNRKLEEMKQQYESEIVRLKDMEERSAEQAQFNLEASKIQAQIANEAQQNYENELVKHAEAAKALQPARAEANQLRLEVIELRTKVEIVQTDLQQKESSWSELKERYEKELNDLKKRREEVLQQNNHLHSQLENVTHQITALQKDRAAHVDGAISGTPGAGLDNLQEVINYLRREKEIVDVQYHLSTQEAKRLRQQLDFVQSQLDETRLKLDQQRRAEADSDRNAISHSKMMDTLNELNLFRESSVTLRAEAKRAADALAEKTKRVEQLTEQIQPLKQRISELENLTDLRDGQNKQLQEERDHWQQRCHNILSKYDRVDPAELDGLRENIAALEAERDQLITEREELRNTQADLQSQVNSIPEQIEAAKGDLRTRIGEQFKTRSKELTTRIRDKQTELDAVTVEKATLQEQLEEIQAKLEEVRAQNPISINGQHSEQVPQQDTTAGQTVDASELTAKVAQMQTAIEQKETELANLKKESEEKFKSREQELKDVLNKRLNDVKKELNIAKATALEELREKLTTEHQQEIEALKATSAPVTAQAQVNEPEAGEVTNTEQKPAGPPSDVDLSSISETQARALVQQNEIIRNILKTNIRKAIEKEREKAMTSEGNPATMSSEQSVELEAKFSAEREALIKEKEQQFEAEKQQMLQQFEERLGKEKDELVAQHLSSMELEKLEFSKEAERKIAEQVANAVALAEKRGSVKFSMAENRARTAGAKLEVVKIAAQETPEKPVGEVWEVAKDTKAPPPPKPAVPAQTQQPSAIPAPATTAPVQPTAAPATKNAAGDEPIVKSDSNQQNFTEEANKPQPTPATGVPPTLIRQLQSGLPRGGFRGRAGGQAGQILQPHQPQQQAQQLPQMQLPQPSGAARGTGIPRGRGGRGGGRGGAQNVNTNLPQPPAGRGGPPAGAASPTRGALNPQAQQFTPGGGQNKRSRDESDNIEDNNQGKRIRGGGAGS